MKMYFYSPDVIYTMTYSSSLLYNSMIAYIIFVIIVVNVKPVWMYDYKNNKFKEFGTNNNQTFMSLHMTCIIASIMIFLLFSFLEMLIMQNKKCNILKQFY